MPRAGAVIARLKVTSATNAPMPMPSEITDQRERSRLGERPYGMSQIASDRMERTEGALLRRETLVHEVGSRSSSTETLHDKELCKPVERASQDPSLASWSVDGWKATAEPEPIRGDMQARAGGDASSRSPA
jgi:hypothetical protein